MSRLNWYICKNILKTFVTIFIVLNVLMLAKTAIDQSGLTVSLIRQPFELLKLWAAMLPFLNNSTAPMAFIIAVYLNIYKLSINHEIIALRSFGLSVLFLCRPFLVLALPLGTLMLTNFFYFSPWGMHYYEERKVQLAMQFLSSGFKPGEPNLVGDQMMFFRAQQDGALEDVILADSRQPDRQPIIEAEQLIVGYGGKAPSGSSLHMSEGRLLMLGEAAEQDMISFKEMSMPVSKNSEFFGSVDWDRLNKSEDQYERLGNLKRIELDLNDLIFLIRNSEPQSEKYYFYLTEAIQRMNSPINGCVLAFFALPMGHVNPRGRRARNLIFMLGLTTAYYINWMVFESAGRSGSAHPILMLLFGLVASALTVLILKMQDGKHRRTSEKP